MGLNINDVKFLLWAKQEGVDFGKVVMIGRQKLYLDARALEAALAHFGIHEPKVRLETIISGEQGYAEPLFKFLGATEACSIDASSYEGASHVIDMNQPVSEEMKGRFSVVFDGGSLEHVFNFPVAVRNCMEMVRLNGHFIGITPCNNYMGHGFFQFSPELFFRIFSEQNGFEIDKMILYEVSPAARWYQVSDPQAIGRRAEVRTRRNTLLIVQARRKAIKPLFATTPQQSDYAAVWHDRSAPKPVPGAGEASRPSLGARIKGHLPQALREVIWKLRESAQPRLKSEALREIQIPGVK